MNAFGNFGIGSWSIHVSLSMGRVEDDDELGDIGVVESLVERADLDEPAQLGFRRNAIPKPRPPSS